MNHRSSEPNIRTLMKKSYIDYAMSVIIARALPDVQGRTEAGAEEDAVRYV